MSTVYCLFDLQEPQVRQVYQDRQEPSVQQEHPAVLAQLDLLALLAALVRQATQGRSAALANKATGVRSELMALLANRDRPDNPAVRD